MAFISSKPPNKRRQLSEQQQVYWISLSFSLVWRSVGGSLLAKQALFLSSSSSSAPSSPSSSRPQLNQNRLQVGSASCCFARVRVHWHCRNRIIATKGLQQSPIPSLKLNLQPVRSTKSLLASTTTANIFLDSNSS